jgi:two-component system NtrC family sensor kinase
VTAPQAQAPRPVSRWRAVLTRNLTLRVVILLMLALMSITALTDYVRLSRDREQLMLQTQEDERIFAETLALAVSRNVRWGRTTTELKELLEDILARPGLVAVTIYSPEAQVVTETVAPGATPPAPDDAVRSVLRQKEPLALPMDSASGPLLRYIQPFRWPGGRMAALEVRQTLGGMERQFRRAVRERILTRLAILALFVLSLIAVTRWGIARPIRRLISGARAVGTGDLDQRIEITRQDEIGQLAEEFNRMAANLQAAHTELLRQAQERLKLEQEVQQSQKLAEVGMLAAKMAHEIGTPLNVISGRAEVLEQVIPPDHPDRRHLEVIIKQSERISGTIRTLLDYTRPRRPSLRPEPLLPILGRVASLLMERSQRRSVRIHLDLPFGLPLVLADPDQLQQAFLNLVKNALDASPPGSVVRLATAEDPLLKGEGLSGVTRGKAEVPALAVHVLDSGKGMTAEQLDRVFEPFFSTKGQGVGTGLGLPIVEEIIRAHRGEIEMLSAPGTGTEVIVRLPLAEPPSPAPTPAPPEAAPETADHDR